MNYKATKSDVNPKDQHQDLNNDLDFSRKDILAFVIAGLQLVLPIVVFFIAGLLLFLVIFQMFF